MQRKNNKIERTVEFMAGQKNFYIITAPPPLPKSDRVLFWIKFMFLQVKISPLGYNCLRLLNYILNPYFHTFSVEDRNHVFLCPRALIPLIPICITF